MVAVGTIKVVMEEEDTTREAIMDHIHRVVVITHMVIKLLEGMAVWKHAVLPVLLLFAAAAFVI
jgi:hypothetical protein